MRHVWMGIKVRLHLSLGIKFTLLPPIRRQNYSTEQDKLPSGWNVSSDSDGEAHFQQNISKIYAFRIHLSFTSA